MYPQFHPTRTVVSKYHQTVGIEDTVQCIHEQIAHAPLKGLVDGLLFIVKCSLVPRLSSSFPLLAVDEKLDESLGTRL